MTDNRRVALHLNNLATILQQLAVELVEPDPPYSQQLAERVHPLASVAEPARPASMYRDRGPLDEPPASVAEPECGCSLYTRCDTHDAERHRTCKCNGPRFASSNCPLIEHRQVANVYPDRDPALYD